MLDSLKQKKNFQRIKMRIKTGDLVKVINGKEKGKTGEVLKTIPLEIGRCTGGHASHCAASETADAPCTSASAEDNTATSVSTSTFVACRSLWTSKAALPSDPRRTPDATATRQDNARQRG